MSTWDYSWWWVWWLEPDIVSSVDQWNVLSLQCPWGTPENTTISCSLADVMSEQLAKELQLEEESVAFPKVVS